jgi:DNA-binding HxlR family transcriptional regulator
MSDSHPSADPSQGQVCPVAHTLKVLGASKWTGYVIRELLGGTKRFGEIRRGVGEANPKPLTDTLRVLEDMDMITRTVHAEVPPRVEYALTTRGRSLTPVIEAMAAWGTTDLQAQTASPSSPTRV